MRFDAGKDQINDACLQANLRRQIAFKQRDIRIRTIAWFDKHNMIIPRKELATTPGYELRKTLFSTVLLQTSGLQLAIDPHKFEATQNRTPSEVEHQTCWHRPDVEEEGE